MRAVGTALVILDLSCILLLPLIFYSTRERIETTMRVRLRELAQAGVISEEAIRAFAELHPDKRFFRESHPLIELTFNPRQLHEMTVPFLLMLLPNTVAMVVYRWRYRAPGAVADPGSP